jgi:CysZ protein
MEFQPVNQAQPLHPGERVMQTRKALEHDVISFLSSFLYVMRGAVFLRSHRQLWKYAAAPLAISAALLGTSYALLYRLCVALSASFKGDAWYTGVIYYLLMTVLILTLTVAFFFLVGRVASALAAPFNEVLSRKTEALVTGREDMESFSAVQLLKDSGRSLLHSLRFLGIYVGLMVVGLVLLLIPVVGGFLYAVAAGLIAALLFAYEYLGYPMDRRRFSWQDKRVFLRSQFRQVIAFGLGVAVTASVPVVNLLFIPAAAIGGTLLFHDLGSGKAPSDTRPGARP